MQFESLSYGNLDLINFEDFSKKSEHILSRFGIAGNQLKIYLHLMKEGPKTASQLSKFLLIPRTEVYTLLKILQEKGFIISKNGRPMLFMAAPFENALNKKIEREKNKIQDLENFLLYIKDSAEFFNKS